MVHFSLEGVVFASICLPSAFASLLSFNNDTANGMYGMKNKAQMSFQCDQQPLTHFPSNCELSCIIRLNHRGIPGFQLAPQHLQFKGKLQQLSPYLDLSHFFYGLKSMPVPAAPRPPVPVFCQPVAADVKY